MSSAIRQRQTASRWIIIATAAALASFIAWASVARIDTITRAQGQVIASDRTQTVQAPDGGVLVELLVKEGDPVRKGQLVATLDRSRAGAAFSDSQGKVAALRATLARLRAEVFNRPLEFDESLEDFPAFVQNQTDLYYRRQQALHAELAALQQHRALAQRELDMTAPLLESGDVSRAEVLRLQRQVAEIGAQITNRRNKYFQDAQAEMTRAEEELATQEQVMTERRAILEHTELYASESGLVKSVGLVTGSKRRRTGWLDARSVLADMGGDLEGYRGLAEVFLEHAATLRAQMTAPRDRLALLGAMHEAANSCGIVGATEAGRRIRAGEDQLRRQPGAPVAEAAQETLRILGQVCVEVERWLAANPPGDRS